MDEIDITNIDFSLENLVSDKCNNLLFDFGTEYDLYIYVGIFIILSTILIIAYKIYKNKNKRVTFQDKLDECYGDKCPV
tara:strand:- start:118 stop:354 length:237 start_codon:yes stop_codon:yes gene_type:complete